jgi:hypothetical protein
VIFFWSGFLILILCGVACLLVLDYFFFDTTKNHGVTQEVFTVDNKTVTEERLDKKPIIKNDTLSNDGVEIKNMQSSFTESDKGVSEKKLDPIPDLKSKPIDVIITNSNAQRFAFYGSSNTIVLLFILYYFLYKNHPQVKTTYGCLRYGKEIKKIAAIDNNAVVSINGYSSLEEDPSSDKKRADYLREYLLKIGIDTTKIKTTDSFHNVEFEDGAAKRDVDMEITRTNYLPLDTSSNASAQRTRMKRIKSNPSFPFSYKKIISRYQKAYFYKDQAVTFYISKIKEKLQESPSKNTEVYAPAYSIGNTLNDISIAEVISWTIKRISTPSGIPNFSMKCI